MPLVSPEGRHKLIAVMTVAVVFAGGATLVRACRIARDAGRTTTFDRTRNVLVRRLNVPYPVVQPGSSLDRDLRPGGFSRVELQDALQDEFGVELLPEEMHQMQTVQDLVAGVDAAAAREGPDRARRRVLP